MELSDIWIFGIGIVLVMLLVLAINAKKIGDGFESWMVRRALYILERYSEKTEARRHKRAAQQAKAQAQRGNRLKPSTTEEKP